MGEIEDELLEAGLDHPQRDLLLHDEMVVLVEAALENQPTTASSKPSTERSGPNASTRAGF